MVSTQFAPCRSFGFVMSYSAELKSAERGLGIIGKKVSYIINKKISVLSADFSTPMDLELLPFKMLEPIFHHTNSRIKK